MNLPNAPVLQDGFFVTHFLTVRDQAKSREFYVGIIGGKVVAPENPCYIKLANSWIILNSGGGPTPDKPGWELRCYMRDPDSYLSDVGQYSQKAIDRFKEYSG